MKAVITGGSGFVGKRLANALANKGWEVIVFSRRSNKNSGEIKTVKVNYFDIDDLTKNLEGVDIIFHLAAVLFANNKQEFEKGNTLLTANLVQAAKKAKTVKHFIYQSSLAAAGPSKNTEILIDETCPCAPVSDYGKTKLMGETEVKKLHPITYTILRAPTVYGGAEAGVSKISAWVKRGLMVNPSKKDMYFSFVYVGDLVDTLIMAATNNKAKNETFFISENAIYTWEDFIQKLSFAMGVKKPIILNLPPALLKLAGFCYGNIAKIMNTVPALNYDKVAEALAPGHWACSSKKWVNLTGQKFLSLDEGLKETYRK